VQGMRVSLPAAALEVSTRAQRSSIHKNQINLGRR
jgi:hypothetical protein